MAAGGPADGLQELTGHVNLDGASCVNERPGFELRGALEGTGLLKSDDNDELLLQLPFKGSVHARFIEIEAPAGERRPRYCRRAVRARGHGSFHAWLHRQTGPLLRTSALRAPRRPPAQGYQDFPQQGVDAD